MDRRIFVLSSGRSGSAWVADLLNECSNATAVHEPFGGKHEHTRKAAFSEQESKEYIHGEFMLKLPVVKEDVHVIVDSFLRNDSEQLKQYGDVVHLIRDPADCIRSHMERNSVIQDGEYRELVPQQGKHKKNWSKYSPFQKVCWYWWRANKSLWNTVDYSVKLEALTTDWKSVESFLTYFDLHLDQDIWFARKDQKKNATDGDYLIPPPSQWPEERWDEFKEICGPLSEELGYAS